MGKIVIPNQPCPDCGSSDALQVYENGTRFCFSCRKWYGNDEMTYETKRDKITPEQLETFATRGIKDRYISKQVAEFYNVKTAYNEDGEPSTYAFQYDTESWKVRNLPKDFYWINKTNKLFGQNLFNAGGKRLVICEGEIDTLSVAQASYEKYKRFYPVVGIPSSTMTKSILENRDWVRSFDEVVICFDEHDVGHKAQLDAVRIVGYDKARIVKLPENDANDVLLKLNGTRLLQCIYDASPYKPAGIIGKDALWDRLVARTKIPSVLYPAFLEGVNLKTKGMRAGEISLFISGTGCFGKGTEILMYNGTRQNVEDIVVGDLVMGDDNTPRNVLRLCRGFEQMYLIVLRDGTNFICNESHVLSLVYVDKDFRWGHNQNDIVNVTVKDYLSWSLKRKHLHKAFKTGPLEFTKRALLIPPYVLGVWLGDGTSASSDISCHIDNIEVINKLNTFNYNFEKKASKFIYNSVGDLRYELKRMGLLNAKRIPDEYLISSIEDRLELLAGLLDTDGCYDSVKNGYEFSQKSYDLISQVKQLAESLGYACSIGKQVNNKFGNCYRLWINGEGLEYIPVALDYKKARKRLQKKNPNRYSFDVIPLEVDDYYGFEVDGNNLFVLGNNVVTHNSGKSTLLREIMLERMAESDDKIGILSLEESPEETAQKLSGMQLHRNPANEEISLEDLKPGFDAIFTEGQFYLLDHQGSISDNSIIEKLEYMCLSGCSYIFIDHITILVSEGVEKLTGNEAVDAMMNSLLRLVKRYPVWIGLISHLRKTSNTTKGSFEEGLMPSLDDIKGCLAYDTEVLLSTGESKKVQDINVGDMLLGDDGTPREVLTLKRGTERMYAIVMDGNEDYFICNLSHILTLSREGEGVYDIPLYEFLNFPQSFKSTFKQTYFNSKKKASTINVVKMNIRNYYGFTLDGNGRFVLGNHIVTHNSGSIKQISADVIAFARNSAADDEEERRKVKIKVLKCRHTGLTGPAGGMQYHFKTGRLGPIDVEEFTEI